VFEAKPEGNYVFIKGSSADPNADFLHSGQLEVLGEAIKGGKIKNVGEAYTDGWLPANAQRNMEQFLTANRNKVDAVVASNDGIAGGAIAALAAQGMAGPVPVSGQDGDHAALNRVALGTQTVSVVEGRAPAWPDGGRAGDDARQGHQARGTTGHAQLGRRPAQGRDDLDPADTGADHQGQPRRRHTGRLGEQGRGLSRREAGDRQGLQLRS